MSLEILFNYEKGKLRSGEDALVCCVHSFLIGRGFKCVGHGEQAPTATAKKSDMLPSSWAEGHDHYALTYQHETSGETFLLKIVKFDRMLLVNFLRFKDERVASFEIRPTDYVENNLSSFDTAFKNLDKLWKLLDTELLNTFANKSKTCPPSKSTEQPRSEPHQQDPLRATPGRRQWEEHASPFGIGRSDLDPFAGPGSGMIFDPMRSGMPSYGSPAGGIGGPNRLPRGAVPPGARFDPFGPPDLDPSGSRYPDFRNSRSGPDPDHLPPPGYDDMFM